MTTIRSAGMASRLLSEYEDRNRDLPRKTRRLMGMFAIAHSVGVDALEELYDRPVGQTPFRHRAWFWYSALRTAGVGHLWPRFAERRNSGESFDEVLRWLREQVSKDEWSLLAARLGRDHIAPSSWSREASGDLPRDYWTAGGTWHRQNNFTRIIVLGEHIDRDYDYNQLTRALGEGNARILEKEIHNLVDEESQLEPHAKWQAVRYAQSRITELAGWHGTPGASTRTVSWFFQERIPESEGSQYFYDWRWPYEERRQRSGNTGRAEWWAWLPPKED